MLNISGINNGVVLDHIQAGTGLPGCYHQKCKEQQNGPQGYHQDRGQLRSA